MHAHVVGVSTNLRRWTPNCVAMAHLEPLYERGVLSLVVCLAAQEAPHAAHLGQWQQGGEGQHIQWDEHNRTPHAACRTRRRDIVTSGCGDPAYCNILFI